MVPHLVGYYVRKESRCSLLIERIVMDARHKADAVFTDIFVLG